LEKLRELERFAYKIDLLFQTTKITKNTVEVPIHFGIRVNESSKFNIKEMITSYKLVIQIRLEESKRLIRFGIVGATGFIINYVFIRLFRSFGFSETLTWIFATELAIINNFIFNNLWTFSEKKINGIKEIVFKFVQFNVTSGGALVIQSVLGPLGVGMFGEKYTVFVLAFVVAFVVLPYNYLMYNLVIWKTWKLNFSKKLR